MAQCITAVVFLIQLIYMKPILSIATLLLLLCSCEKDYNCVCEDTKGTRSNETFEISSASQQTAVNRCATYETELNRSNTSYSCHLEN